jgi:hypothetical protein
VVEIEHATFFFSPIPVETGEKPSCGGLMKNPWATRERGAGREKAKVKSEITFSTAPQAT